MEGDAATNESNKTIINQQEAIISLVFFFVGLVSDAREEDEEEERSSLSQDHAGSLPATGPLPLTTPEDEFCLQEQMVTWLLVCILSSMRHCCAALSRMELEATAFTSKKSSSKNVGEENYARVR